MSSPSGQIYWSTLELSLTIPSKRAEVGGMEYPTSHPKETFSLERRALKEGAMKTSAWALSMRLKI